MCNLTYKKPAVTLAQKWPKTEAELGLKEVFGTDQTATWFKRKRGKTKIETDEKQNMGESGGRTN